MLQLIDFKIDKTVNPLLIDNYSVKPFPNSLFFHPAIHPSELVTIRMKIN